MNKVQQAVLIAYVVGCTQCDAKSRVHNQLRLLQRDLEDEGSALLRSAIFHAPLPKNIACTT